MELVKEHAHEHKINEYRTSVTVLRDEFEIFKDICKRKYDADPVNSGIREAIADFNSKNKEYLSDKYSKMKEMME